MKFSDVLFKGTVTVLAAASLVGGIGVSISMFERFSYHRQVWGGEVQAGGGSGGRCMLAPGEEAVEKLWKDGAVASENDRGAPTTAMWSPPPFSGLLPTE